jgi:hypothetical protein
MKQEYVKLLEDSGFILWGDEAWKPEGAVVDWATNYDNEIEKLIDSLLKQRLERDNGQE